MQRHVSAAIDNPLSGHRCLRGHSQYSDADVRSSPHQWRHAHVSLLRSEVGLQWANPRPGSGNRARRAWLAGVNVGLQTSLAVREQEVPAAAGIGV